MAAQKVSKVLVESLNEGLSMSDTPPLTLSLSLSPLVQCRWTDDHFTVLVLATVTLLASSIVDNAYLFMGQASFPSPINSPDLDVKQNADRTPP